MKSESRESSNNVPLIITFANLSSIPTPNPTNRQMLRQLDILDRSNKELERELASSKSTRSAFAPFPNVAEGATASDTPQHPPESPPLTSASITRLRQPPAHPTVARSAPDQPPLPSLGKSSNDLAYVLASLGIK
jgi:hypothetical protein